MSGRFEGSSGVGAMNDDGTFLKEVSEYRTSRNAWCHEEPCKSLESSMNVEDKIDFLTGVPRENQEFLQVGASPPPSPASLVIYSPGVVLA